MGVAYCSRSATKPAMASVTRTTFNACKAPMGRNGTQFQQVRWSGAMQQVKIRMKSVKNISKITKAMQMVAASKLKGAEKRVAAGWPRAGQRRASVVVGK